MKLSLNWLKEYIDIDLSPEEVSHILTSIGLEVEGEEVVESVKGGLKGIVIGQVIECDKHPNADKLSVTKVDIGAEFLLDIVCGAPNIAVGQKVLVATVGTTLHPTEGDAFKIKKSKIRGAASEGMICAEDELGLGTGHDGILVLPETVAVGTPAHSYYEIEEDVVYEIGLTPNRSDATNHLGSARDLAAYLKVNHNPATEVRVPSIADFKIDNNDLPVQVEVRNTKACPRYSGISIKGVTIKESPTWLKNRLNAIGVRPISNIVDITNFILHELGQPLHAFDLDKITDQKIIVQTLAEGALFTSLDERERKLSAHDLMICDGADKGMCIGGVFGGLTSGVTDDTKNIFLEAAHFNPKWIRKSSFRHDLRSDAAKVFEKGSDPNISVFALKRAAMMMQELAGGEIASDIVDIYPDPIKPLEIEVRYQRVNRLIGADISPEEVKNILTAMDMDIKVETDTAITVAVPTNKADVLREVDIIEEILRIYGFNKVEMPTYIKTAITYGKKPDPQTVRNKVSDYLTANSFHEIMGLSLVESRYFEKILPIENKQLVFINNTSNITLDVMRPTMLFSGLESIVRNQNRQHSDLNLYEFGRTYLTIENGHEEQEHLSLFMTGKRWNESWLFDNKAESAFYTLKTMVDNVLASLGIVGYQETVITQNDTLAFGMRYHRGQQVLVEFGKVQAKIAKKMDIKNAVFYADFQWNNVMKALKKGRISMTPLNKHFSVRRDLALVIDNSVKFSDIATIARKVGKKLLNQVNLFDVYENKEQLGEDKKSYALSFFFSHPERTLKIKEIDKIMNKLISEYERKLSALIRR